MLKSTDLSKVLIVKEKVFLVQIQIQVQIRNILNNFLTLQERSIFEYFCIFPKLWEIRHMNYIIVLVCFGENPDPDYKYKNILCY